jgi:hypothetical protein
MSQICRTCHRDFPLSAFHKKQKNRGDGYRTQCKDCAAASKAAAYQARRATLLARIPDNPAEGTKRCSDCQQDLPHTSFSPDASNTQGLKTYCKTCSAQRIQQYRQQYPDRCRAQAKAGYQSQVERRAAIAVEEEVNPETTFKRCSGCKTTKRLIDFNLHRGMLDGRQTICKECQSQTQTKRRAEDEEYRLKEIQRCADYRLNNLEKEQERGRKYNQEHPEEARLSHRAWAAANPAAIRNYSARRRARESGLPDTLTTADIAFLYQYWGFACAVCGKEEGLFNLKLALDHWIPINDPACPGTVRTNILLLCHGRGGCNNSKHGKDPVLWLTRRYGERRAKAILKKIDAYFALVAEASLKAV